MAHKIPSITKYRWSQRAQRSLFILICDKTRPKLHLIQGAWPDSACVLRPHKYPGGALVGPLAPSRTYKLVDCPLYHLSSLAVFMILSWLDRGGRMADCSRKAKHG
ncbi:hypothetical protein CPB86DRAFT_130145 [Serendipita vermifera]|nr:hypothetical protein CPB86DRAFT_130145 [Serendipita vermifera]